MTKDPGEVVTLFEDDFSSYPLCERMDDPAVAAAFGLSAAQAKLNERIGPWTLTTIHYSWSSERIPDWMDCHLPWRIVEREGRRFLEQPESFFNVAMKAGDPEWRDYALELDLAVSDGPAGPIVRYRTSRQNYRVVFQTGRAPQLVRRNQEEFAVLAIASGPIIERDRLYHCRVECDGPWLAVAVDGREVIRARDATWGAGQIALLTEGPARFAGARVTAGAAEAEAIAERKRSRAAQPSRAYPQARLIHTVTLPRKADWLHVQDVNDDGRPEVLAVELAVPELDYIRVARLTVLDWEGKMLWEFGEPLEGKYRVHGGFAFNAGDVDGDGRTEIVITRDFEFLILDGRTGAVKKRAPTPRTFLDQEDHFPRMVGDSILICNLRGKPTPQDLVLKDRYRNLWAFTSDLVPLWHRHLNVGHYPRARDINDDGRDEVMAGYSMLAHDGRTLWTVPGGDPDYNYYPGPEHNDSVLIERFGPGEDAPLRIAMAASDLGFMLLDTDGRLLAQHRVGHAQNLGAARFRPDLPGRQFVVHNAWGNYGIMSLFDSEGRLLLTREESGMNRCIPVNWTGDGRALLLFRQGLCDGNFEPVAKLPLGTISASPCVDDVNEDGVDEIYVGHDSRLEVYGPEVVPPPRGAAKRRDLTNWDPYGGFYL